MLCQIGGATQFLEVTLVGSLCLFLLDDCLWEPETHGGFITFIIWRTQRSVEPVLFWKVFERFLENLWRLKFEFEF